MLPGIFYNAVYCGCIIIVYLMLIYSWKNLYENCKNVKSQKLKKMHIWLNKMCVSKVHTSLIFAKVAMKHSDLISL